MDRADFQAIEGYMLQQMADMAHDAQHVPDDPAHGDRGVFGINSILPWPAGLDKWGKGCYTDDNRIESIFRAG